MDVHIGEISSIVRAVDGDSVLTPQMMEKIVQAVLRAAEERELHRQRVRAETRVSGGVFHEMEKTFD
jgi:hypothetical protein